jgi:hypothetical protein
VGEIKWNAIAVNPENWWRLIRNAIS